MTNEDQLEAIFEEQRRLMGEIRHLASSIRELDHAIRGNGRPGLVTRVSILEDRSGRMSMVAGAIATVIASAIAAIAAAIN